jgi:uncharacterized protein YhaN
MSSTNMSREELMEAYQKILSHIEEYQQNTKGIHEEASRNFSYMRYILHLPDNASRERNTVYQKKKTAQQAEINRLFDMVIELQKKSQTLHSQYSTLMHSAKQANPSKSASLSESKSKLQQLYDECNDLMRAYRVVYDEKDRLFSEMERVEEAYKRSVPLSIAEEEDNAESSGGRRYKKRTMRTLRKKRAHRKRTHRNRA